MNSTMSYFINGKLLFNGRTSWQKDTIISIIYIYTKCFHFTSKTNHPPII